MIEFYLITIAVGIIMIVLPILNKEDIEIKIVGPKKYHCPYCNKEYLPEQIILSDDEWESNRCNWCHAKLPEIKY